MNERFGLNRSCKRATFSFLAALACLGWTPEAVSYPLDGAGATGIARLEAYRLRESGAVSGTSRLYPGAKLSGSRIQLKLTGRPDFELPAPDPALNAELYSQIGGNSGDYGMALLDMTNPAKPRYAEINPDKEVNPGSVGKLMVALGLFQTLADIYPDSTSARMAVLRNTMITADKFIIKDSHDVPIWRSGQRSITMRPIQIGDRANLYTYLDWMLSSSSNAAAAMVQKQMVLLQHYGRSYPRPEAEMDSFLASTTKGKLGSLFAKAIQDPIRRNGLSLGKIRQGSFFTGTGKAKVPGTSSIITARELLKFLVRMEQGRLVDRWSSLEMKRLIYLTDGRIRYAASRKLWDSAVYFKSGSLYSCQPEAGFTCKKYHGNKRNFMNSAAIIESVNRTPALHYFAVVLSNVLKKNSATEHRVMAGKLHNLIEKTHGGTVTNTSEFGAITGGSGPVITIEDNPSRRVLGGGRDD